MLSLNLSLNFNNSYLTYRLEITIQTGIHTNHQLECLYPSYWRLNDPSDETLKSTQSVRKQTNNIPLPLCLVGDAQLQSAVSQARTTQDDCVSAAPWAQYRTAHRIPNSHCQHHRYSTIRHLAERKKFNLENQFNWKSPIKSGNTHTPHIMRTPNGLYDSRAIVRTTIKIEYNGNGTKGGVPQGSVWSPRYPLSYFIKHIGKNHPRSSSKNADFFTLLSTNNSIQSKLDEWIPILKLTEEHISVSECRAKSNQTWD